MQRRRPRCRAPPSTAQSPNVCLSILCTYPPPPDERQTHPLVPPCTCCTCCFFPAAILLLFNSCPKTTPLRPVHYTCCKPFGGWVGPTSSSEPQATVPEQVRAGGGRRRHAWRPCRLQAASPALCVDIRGLPKRNSTSENAAVWPPTLDEALAGREPAAANARPAQHREVADQQRTTSQRPGQPAGRRRRRRSWPPPVVGRAAAVEAGAQERGGAGPRGPRQRRQVPFQGTEGRDRACPWGTSTLPAAAPRDVCPAAHRLLALASLGSAPLCCRTSSRCRAACS